MLIICPNCASSYGVDMASLRPARGWTRKLRCSRCRFLWQAEISAAEKLMIAADAVLPVRRAMLAAAQVAADAARSRLPHLRRETTILAEELAAVGARPAQSSITAPKSARRAAPPLAKRVGAGWRRLVDGIAAIGIHIVAGLKRQAWRPSWRPSWRLSWPPSLSHLHYIVVGLALADATIIGWRTDVVWAMPQTARFYAAFGLPVSVRGVQFDHLTTAAEQHDGAPILIVKGEIGNSTDKPETVPHLRFAILNSQRQEIYSWTAVPARGQRLPAGETLTFRSELTLPPPDTRAVAVRFIDPENSF